MVMPNLYQEPPHSRQQLTTFPSAHPPLYLGPFFLGQCSRPRSAYIPVLITGIVPRAYLSPKAVPLVSKAHFSLSARQSEHGVHSLDDALLLPVRLQQNFLGVGKGLTGCMGP